MTPTTRRFPRTLSEAFPKDPDYACAIYCTPGTWLHTTLSILAACLIGIALAAALVIGWSS